MTMTRDLSEIDERSDQIIAELEIEKGFQPDVTEVYGLKKYSRKVAKTQSHFSYGQHKLLIATLMTKNEARRIRDAALIK